MTASVVISLLARGVLAAVFAYASLSKLRDRARTRRQLNAVGLPPNLDLTLATVEAFTALGIVMERRSAWSVFVAMALLVGFCGFVARQLAVGNHAPCPCFGSGAHERPTDLWTLARNLFLLSLAVVATSKTGAGQWLVWLVAACGVTLFSVVNATSATRAR